MEKVQTENLTPFEKLVLREMIIYKIYMIHVDIRERTFMNSDKLENGDYKLHEVKCAICGNPTKVPEYLKYNVCGNCLDVYDYG